MWSNLQSVFQTVDNNVLYKSFETFRVFLNID